MRWFILSFFLSTLGLSGASPSDVALGILGDLQKVETVSELTEKLAISVFCGPEKRKIITQRWRSRAASFKGGEVKILPLGEKVDGEIAAVLLGVYSKSNPDEASVLALGLVLKGEVWKVAPVEGSFDNTGLGFSAEIKARVKTLEDWMILEKAETQARVIDEERARFNKSLEGSVDAELLKLEDPEDIISEFLKAAHAGELNKLLVWQGVLERDELPERNWKRDIRATRRGMTTVDPKSAWRTLRSNKVMKVVVEGSGDEEEGSYLLSLLSSFETNPRNQDLNPVRIDLLMTKGGWRIKLPPFLSYDGEGRDEHRKAFNESFDWGDRSSAKQMGYVFEVENEATRTESPKEMIDGVLADLAAGNVDSFLKRLYREEENFEEEEEPEEGEEELPAVKLNGGDRDIDDRRMERYREAIDWWGKVLGKNETRKGVVRKFYEEGDLALFVIEVGTDASGWKPIYQPLWMAKGDEGWMVLPGVTEPLNHSIAPELKKVREEMSKTFRADLDEFEKAFIVEIIKSFGVDDPEGSAIDEEGGLKLLKEWGKVAREGRVLDLVEKSAVRAVPEKPEEFMRDLGFLRAVAASPNPNKVLGSMAVGRFRAYSMMMDVGGDVVSSYPLVIVVPTKDGHRVLTDIELPLETNKGLRIMNDARVKNLKKTLAEADLKAIEELRAWHQKVAKPVWEKEALESAEKH